jgi:hypothetical protein
MKARHIERRRPAAERLPKVGGCSEGAEINQPPSFGRLLAAAPLEEGDIEERLPAVPRLLDI